jgi:hypothetical protein
MPGAVRKVVRNAGTADRGRQRRHNAGKEPFFLLALVTFVFWAVAVIIDRDWIAVAVAVLMVAFSGWSVSVVCSRRNTWWTVAPSPSRFASGRRTRR